MATSSVKSLPEQSAGKMTGDIEQPAFSLRDTLSGIVVRETNFSEFLVALKQFGMTPAKQ